MDMNLSKLGDSEGQGRLVCGNTQGCKVLDTTTEQQQPDSLLSFLSIILLRDYAMTQLETRWVIVIRNLIIRAVEYIYIYICLSQLISFHVIHR